MAKGHKKQNCKFCNRHIDECGPLSARYLCVDCGHARVRENLANLHYHNGAYFENWRRKHAGAVGGILVDDLIEGS